jgi:hypothetical protein
MPGERQWKLVGHDATSIVDDFDARCPASLDHDPNSRRSSIEGILDKLLGR